MTSTLLVYHSIYRVWVGVVFALILQTVVIAVSLISTWFYGDCCLFAECCPDSSVQVVIFILLVFVIALLICVICAGILGFIAFIVPVVVVVPIVFFSLKWCI